jgi:hypothetical protein
VQELTMGVFLMWMRWMGSLTRGIGARGQPNTPSRSLKSCLLAGMLPYKETVKLFPAERPLCNRNHSRIISHELSFLLPSSCISGSGPSSSGVKVCVHHLCFHLALEPMNVWKLVLISKWILLKMMSVGVGNQYKWAEVMCIKTIAMAGSYS